MIGKWCGCMGGGGGGGRRERVMSGSVMAYPTLS